MGAAADIIIPSINNMPTKYGNNLMRSRPDRRERALRRERKYMGRPRPQTFRRGDFAEPFNGPLPFFPPAPVPPDRKTGNRQRTCQAPVWSHQASIFTYLPPALFRHKSSGYLSWPPGRTIPLSRPPPGWPVPLSPTESRQSPVQ